MRQDRAPNPGFWLFIGIIVLVAVGKAVLADTLDPDCFWHLKVAEQMRTDGIRPLVDHISFMSIKDPWTPYSWLAELAMKWVWDLAGYRGAVAVAAACSGAFIVFVAMSCRQLTDRLFNCGVATALAAYLSLPYLSFRPATFAIVLLAVCALLLLRDRKLPQTKAVWSLPLIVALTINVHLMAIFVVMWVGCFLTEALWLKRDVKRYALLLLLCTAGCLCTPMLPGAIRAAWHYQFADVMVASDVIAEMRPVYSGLAGVVTCTLLAALLTLALRNRKQIGLTEWLWLGISTLLLLRLGRFAPIFSIIAAPVLAATLPRLSDAVLVKMPVRLAMTVLLLIGFAQIALSFPTSTQSLSTFVNRNGPDTPGYPCAAADFVDQHVTPQTGHLITEFNWGGYTAWRFNQYQVFLDGRTQLYTADFWRSTYLCDDATRARTLQKIDSDAAIVPVRNSRFRTALINNGWTSAFKDDRAEVLLPPPARRALNNK